MKILINSYVVQHLQKRAFLGFACLVLSACSTQSVIERAVAGDGAGSFRALANTQSHQVQNLPRSRSGNASVYTVFGKQYSVLEQATGFKERGIASWYGKKFHGRDTASGEKYNMYDLTAAHKNLPLPVYARVTNLDNGRQLIVKINDRGPFVDGRVIDLSFAAAHQLGVYETGTANVEVEALSEAVRGGEQVIVAAPEPQTPTTTITPASDTPIPSVQRYGWVVQLGAFKDVDNASTLQNQLESDLAGRSTINHDASAQLYRVLIGPMSSSAEADQLLDSLASAGIDGYTLKARIQ